MAAENQHRAGASLLTIIMDRELMACLRALEEMGPAEPEVLAERVGQTPERMRENLVFLGGFGFVDSI